MPVLHSVSDILFQRLLPLNFWKTERAFDMWFSHRRLISKHNLTIDFQTAINRKGLPQPETKTTLEVHPVDQVNSAAIIDSLMTALRQCEQEIVFGDGRDLIGSSTERDAGSVFNHKARDKSRKTLQFPCYQNHSLLRHAFSTGHSWQQDNGSRRGRHFKFILEQAKRAHKRCRGIALLFL